MSNAAVEVEFFLSFTVKLCIVVNVSFIGAVVGAGIGVVSSSSSVNVTIQ